MKELAERIKEETEILQFFQREVVYSQNIDLGLENRIDYLYSSKYYKFYDILFVDIDGFIFHTIKREDDYQTNLLTGKFSDTKLAGSIIKGQRTEFVDYSFYMPSEEPAAFFIISIDINGDQAGWIILQIPSNKVNIILTSKLSTSRSTEVYLINNQNIMLSDSRFYKDSTAMKVKINSFAVQSTLDVEQGERLVDDYRNISVFSSFEKFEVFGVEWVIIAEIDEDEVITEYYKENNKYLSKEIFNYLEENRIETTLSSGNILSGDRVDIGEYRRVGQGSALWTLGVGSCTAVSVLYPDQFGYLSHISPVDDVYVSGKLMKYFLGDNHTDLLGDILRKVNQFEITPSNYRNIHFYLVANHTNSFEKSVGKILENDFELANIGFLYDPEMENVNVQLDLIDNHVNLNWNDGKQLFYNNDTDFPDLSDILKEIIQY
jgi:hypothetical protein